MKVKGYSNYEVYPETGQIWSYKRKKHIGNKKGNGYIGCTLRNDDGKTEHWLLHRFIWFAVNGEIPCNLQINHIDEDKHNNSIYNLNLMTPSENINWSLHKRNYKAPPRVVTKTHKNGKLSKMVLEIKDGNIVSIYPSTKEVQRRNNNMISSVIAGCCRGERKQVYGSKWQYIDDYLADWWEQEMEKAVL